LYFPAAEQRVGRSGQRRGGYSQKRRGLYVEADNKHDAKAVAALWSPEAVYIDPDTGDEIVGRDDLEKEFADTFSKLKNARLEVRVETVKLMSPNVAVESGVVRIIQVDGDVDETFYSAVDVKRDGKWLLDRVTEEEPPQPVPSSYDYLKELEWMIGSWIDEDEEAMVQTDCQWTKNQNFINRSFAVVLGEEVDLAGMQIVGWDPIAKQKVALAWLRGGES
jgi:uncharacterized protein (TIGR02246 family)